MKYAREVIELMSAYPKREFKTQTLVRYIQPEATPKEKTSIRKGVKRVLCHLIEDGHVRAVKTKNIQSCKYFWV